MAGELIPIGQLLSPSNTYNKTEIDALLDGKANTGGVYTRPEIDAGLNLRALKGQATGGGPVATATGGAMLWSSAQSAVQLGTTDLNELTSNGEIFTGATISTLTGTPTGVHSSRLFRLRVQNLNAHGRVWQEFTEINPNTGASRIWTRFRTSTAGAWTGWALMTQPGAEQTVSGTAHAGSIDFTVSGVNTKVPALQDGTVNPALLPVYQGQIQLPGVNAWVASEGTRMTGLPTHDGSGQAVHPSIHYFPDGFAGYKYWMAVTPYPGRTTQHEDPNIMCSHDGSEWVVPNGAPHPLDDATEGYNSDTNLAYHNGDLYVFWRQQTSSPSQVRIWERHSSDGVTWSPKTLVYQEDSTGMLSPQFHHDGTEWVMYTVGSNTLSRRTNLTLSPAEWTPPVATDMGFPGVTLWHVDIRAYAGGFLALAQNYTGAGNGGGDLWLATSQDGISWDTATAPIMSREGVQHEYLYMGSLVPIIREGMVVYDLYYTGFSSGPVQSWIYRTRLQLRP